jgi:hypothetical protein
MYVVCNYVVENHGGERGVVDFPFEYQEEKGKKTPNILRLPW